MPAATTSNAHIFYTSYGGAALTAIDLGQLWSNRRGPTPQTRKDVSEALSGLRTVVTWDARRRLVYELERFTDRDVMRELEAFQIHARHGRLFSVAENGSKCFAAFLRVMPPGGGATTLFTFANMFEAYTSGGASLVAGDEIYLRAPGPEMAVARCEVASFTTNGSGTRITVSTGAPWDWSLYPWVFVHQAGFWPMLRVPKESLDDEFLTHDHEIHHTFVIPGEESPSALDVLAQEPEIQGEINENWGSATDISGVLDDKILQQDAGLQGDTAVAGTNLDGLPSGSVFN